VLSGLAIGLAVAWAAVGSAPALAGVARPARSADQVRQQEWWLSALHVTQAWQTTKGAGVTIALLDTGVDPNQPDLTGSVISGPDLTNSGESLGGQFFGIHGTAMASLIVGHGHGPGEADGVLGVAPQAKLLSVRVVLDSGDPLLSESSATSALPAAIAAGIMYAVNNGAQVIDLPLDPGQSISALTATPAPQAPAFGTPTAAEAAAAAAAGGSTAEQSAVAYALSKGVILVAPGGDNNATTDAANFPADYPGVISVGAFNSSFTKAAFSSHQHYVTLTAAGDGMIAAVPSPSSGYATVSSTSAASAVVTGIAALIKSQYPELTPAQVTQALTRSTVFRPPGGTEDGSGFGTADAARALAEAGTIAAPGPPRAGAGAVSNPMPAAPAPPVISDAMTAKLRRDGVISLIVLAVLLVPTVVYAVMVRRRIRAIAHARAEISQATRVPYAHNAAGDLDLMSEYFSPIVADSDPPGYARSGNGGSNGGAAAAGATGGLLARSVIPATRLNVTRPPKVSGTPPWEPAPKPDGELPWAGRSLPSRPRRSVPAHLIPAPTASSLKAEPAGGAQDQDLAADSSAADAEAAARLYVWNPGSTTEGSPEHGGDDAAAHRDESAADLGDGRSHYRADDAPAYYGDGPSYPDTDMPGYSDPDDLTGYRTADPPTYRDPDLPGYRDSDPPAYRGQDLPGYSDDDPLAFRNAEPPAYRESDPPGYGDQDTGTYAGGNLPAYGESSAYRGGQANSGDSSGTYGDDPGYRDSAATPGDGDRHSPDSQF
jgi:Subtilase family